MQGLPTEILDATFVLACEQGVHNLSLTSVAEKVGCSRLTIYRRFDSRKGLIRALLDREAERYAEALQKVLSPDLSLPESLERAVAFTIDYHRTHPLLTRILREEPEVFVGVLTTDWQPVLNAVSEIFAQQLERAVEEGYLTDEAAEVAPEWFRRVFIAYLPAHDKGGRLRAWLPKLVLYGLVGPEPSMGRPRKRRGGG